MSTVERVPTSLDFARSEIVCSHLAQNLAIDFQIRGEQMPRAEAAKHFKQREALAIVQNLLLDSAERAIRDNPQDNDADIEAVLKEAIDAVRKEDGGFAADDLMLALVARIIARDRTLTELQALRAGNVSDRMNWDWQKQRDEADAYILSLWRNNLLPRPMPETLRERLAAKK